MAKPPTFDPYSLVFGGSGFLGAPLMRRLEAGPGRATSVSRSVLLDLSPAASQILVDLANAPGRAARLIQQERPDHVYFLTALSRVGDCERDPQLAHDLNVRLPGEVAAASAKLGARLIAISTDLVFDGTPPRPSGYVETDVPKPSHVYGETKAAGEAAVLDAYPSATVVRLPLLFGDSVDRGLGASDSLVHALEQGESPTLFTDEWRTPLDVDVAARALIELASQPQAGILHVGGADRVHRQELAECVLVHLRRAEPRRPYRKSPRRPPVELDAWRSRLKAGKRADLGMEDRPADVSLDSSLAASLLSTRLPGVREWATSHGRLDGPDGRDSS